MSVAPNQSVAAKSDAVLDALVEEFVARLERGEEPSVEDFVRRQPDRADELRQLLPAARVMASLGSTGAVTEPPNRRVPPELRDLGDFRLQREIGRGGMGVVYEAEQLSLGRRVALKVLPFATVLDPRQLQRFKNEARAAATLDHPHIVHVYSVGQDRGVHFYAMQLIEGQSLAEVLSELRESMSPITMPFNRDPEAVRREALGPDALPSADSGSRLNNASTVRNNKRSTEWSQGGRAYFQQVARWGIQAAEALEYAHQLGVVHRDIKPSNLLLNAEGKLWVADFGLAMTRADTGLTMTGDVLGTLRYMSPEQALGQRGVVDQRSDVYSLGITLYELLALRPAFEQAHRAELLRRVELHDPPPLRHVAKAVPAELDTIVFKAINKDPASRYLTAKDLADDLQRFLNDQPIRARAPTWRDRALKWSRRNKGPLVAALIVLVVLSAGIVGTTWGLVRSERARLAEIQHRQLAQESERKALAAAAAEKQAKEQAQAREAETEAVLRFVQNKVFAAARPKGQDGGLGQNVSLRQALQSALPFLNRQLADQPLTEARLRTVLGISFWELGEIEIAAEQFERARTLYTQHLGAKDRITLQSMSWLNNVYNDLQRFDEAAQIGEQALALAQTTLGPDDNVTFHCRHNLAVSYNSVGRSAEALALVEQNLAGRRTQFGPESFEVQEYLGMAGWCYFNLGRHAEALELLEQSLAARRDRFGPNHAETLVCVNWLARCHFRLGQLEAAIALYEDAVTRSKAALGVLHPRTQGSMSWLAKCYTSAGRHDDAISLCIEAVTTSQTIVGADPLLTKKWMDHLADHYASAGRRDDALRVREELLTLQWDKNRPEARPVWESTTRKLIADYVAVGRHAEALKRNEDLLEFHESSLTRDERATALTRNNLAWALATSPDPALRDPMRAVSLAAQAVDFAPTDGNAWNTLGAAQYRVGNWPASLEALEKAMALRDGGNSFDWFFVAMNHWQLGDEPRAREMYHKAVEGMEKNNPDDPELIRFRAECEELLPIETEPTPEPVSR
jgi:serine/threonine protein kinase